MWTCHVMTGFVCSIVIVETSIKSGMHLLHTSHISPPRWDTKGFYFQAASWDIQVSEVKKVIGQCPDIFSKIINPINSIFGTYHLLGEAQKPIDFQVTNLDGQVEHCFRKHQNNLMSITSQSQILIPYILTSKPNFRDQSMRLKQEIDLIEGNKCVEMSHRQPATRIWYTFS